MWPFNSRNEEARKMEQCDHPDWDTEDDEILYPRTVYSEDGELFIRRLVVEHKTCTECGYADATTQREEKVYLKTDRVEEVEEDA